MQHNLFNVTQLFLFSVVFFIVGFLGAWVIRTYTVQNFKKNLKRTEGLLESERLIKETLRKENALAFLLKENVESELGSKIKQAEDIIRVMDEDILLLQKSNEETEKLFQITQPELYSFKLKLIEANNTISRLKSQLQERQSTPQK